MDITKVKVWDKVLKSFYELKAIYFDNDMVGIKIGDEVDGEWTVIKKEHVEFIKPTGLTDRNGVEIYEGDVLKLNNRLMKIKFMGEYNFGYILISIEDSRNTVMLNVDHLKNISVIGNIYEHPHLLEGVK